MATLRLRLRTPPNQKDGTCQTITTLRYVNGLLCKKFMRFLFQTLTIPDSHVTAQFIFIDTIILDGLTDPVNKSLPPQGPASVAAAEEQWTWIEQTLAASTARWLFVLGHYPGE